MVKRYLNGHVLGMGVVCEGTLLPAELGDALCAEYRRYHVHIPDCIREMEWWIQGDADSLRERYDEEQITWEELGTTLLAAILGELNHVAPAGVWFGPHEGDGACFGWWETEEGEA